MVCLIYTTISKNEASSVIAHKISIPVVIIITLSIIKFNCFIWNMRERLLGILFFNRVKAIFELHYIMKGMVICIICIIKTV